jgi:Protein of unknown function (DUF3800)
MEFLYIDESGDNGLVEGSTKFFILAGVAIEANYLKEFFWIMLNFRQSISQRYGLRIQEIKGSDLFYHRGPFFNSVVNPPDLEEIYIDIVNILCESPIQLFATVKSKDEFRTRYSQLNKNSVKIFNEEIWKEFLSIYENYLVDKSRANKHPQNGIIYFDRNPAQDKHIRKIIRERFRRFDTRSEFPAAGIVEDVVLCDSHSSYFIQLADILAFTVSRLLTGRGNNDVFSIKPEIATKLRAKIKGRITQL